MGLSGFLYLAIVVGWAVYLVPFALRRYDEATRNRSIDRFSSTMRVLGPREAGKEAHAPPAHDAKAARRHGSREGEWAAARTAARRRRRVLLTLLLATGATAGSAGLGSLPWWSVAVPGTLVLLWLVVCRRQARREYGRRPAQRPRRAPRPEVPPQGAAAESDDAGTAAPVEQRLPLAGMAGAARAGEAGEDPAAQMPADDEPTVVLEREDLDEEAARYAGSGSLWDPVPVTLPTYVHKPRAPRTIRTIDLGALAAPTLGRADDAAGREPEPVDSPPSVESPEAEEHAPPTRRAVGE